jgi:hypothetical protein
MGGRRPALLALAVAFGCAAPVAQAPPVTMAQLRLPADAATFRTIALEDDVAEKLGRRREILAGMNRQCLMPPPDDAVVPEVFDFATALAVRMDDGTVSAAWGGYLYTVYQRDLRAERPTGRPRRSAGDVAAELDHAIEFFHIRENPHAPRGGTEADSFDALRDWRAERRMGR